MKKKLVKFTTKEVVKEVEKEIELPAYFCMSSKFLPSSVGRGEYFQPIVRIDSPDSSGCMISASMLDYKGHAGLSFGINPYEAGGVIENWTQVPESEWLIAAERLKADIDGKEAQGEQ